MRVLYFSPRDCWPVTTGARVRDFHLARQLAAQGKLTYLGFTSVDERSSGNVWRERLESLGNSDVVLVRRDSAYSPLNILRGWLGPTPISVLNYSSPTMMAELERLLREQTFDAIQIEGVHLFAYVKRIRELAPRARLISDWHNIESELLERYSQSSPSVWKRLYARRTTGLLSGLEQQLLALCDAHTVCSDRERAILAERAPSARIEVIGNGVDVEFFSSAQAAGYPAQPGVRRIHGLPCQHRCGDVFRHGSLAVDSRPPDRISNLSSSDRGLSIRFWRCAISRGSRSPAP